MPEPMEDEYLRRTQQLILRLPRGPWPVDLPEHGLLPDRVGPICFLETWNDNERLPVVEFISFAREALPRYVGEVSRLKDQVRLLERKLRATQRAANGGAHV
ncbi:hypothetical protein [Streptomyces sp. NPDC001089]